MNKMIAGVLAVGMMVFAGVASAADVKGAITAVNAQARTVTIGGVTYTFPANVDMAGLAVGQTVNLTYTTANNVNTVSKVTK
jgi:hypothetical protein